MNQIVYKFSLAGAKFMSGLHSRQAEFTGSTCREFENIVKVLINSKNQMI